MVRTLEKYLDLCEIDDKRLENFYIKLPDECECKFSKNVPFNIDFHIHIKEPHQFDRTMTASERVKAGVRVKVVLNSHVSLNDAKSLCL